MVDNTSPQPDAFAKSIIMGSLAGGILSLMPLINLMNIFFLFWMWVGGAVAIYYLLKHNHQISVGDALLGGASSGLIGSLVFSIPTAFSVLSVSADQIGHILQKVRILYPSASQEMGAFLESRQFKLLFLLMLAFTVIFSVLAGMLAALITRRIYNGKLKAAAG
jgi:hypothetical protein